MKRWLLAMLVPLVLGACKSNDGEYCARAKEARFYDPQRPGLCEEDYKSFTAKQRDCVNECLSKMSVVDCARSCEIGEQPTFVKVPAPGPRASAGAR